MSNSFIDFIKKNFKECNFQTCSKNTKTNKFLVSSNCTTYSGDEIFEVLQKNICQENQSSFSSCDSINFDHQTLLFTEFKSTETEFRHDLLNFKLKFAHSLQLMIMNKYFDELINMNIYGLLVLNDKIRVNGSPYMRKKLDSTRQGALKQSIKEAADQDKIDGLTNALKFLYDNTAMCRITKKSRNLDIHMLVLNNTVFDEISKYF